MLNAVFTHATEGIIVIDTRGIIVLINPKAIDLFGYQNEQLKGAPITVLIPGRLDCQHATDFAGFPGESTVRGMGEQAELVGRRKDGTEFPVEVSLSPFQTHEGRFVVAFIVDISERKKQERRIIEANQQIQQLNADLEERVQQRTFELDEAVRALKVSQSEVIKALDNERELNQLKSQFVSFASHEFRTPLATILSSSSLISRYRTTEEDDKRQKHIQRIRSTVQNLTEILNDFLSIGKLEEGKMQCVPVPIDYLGFCEDLITDVRGLCKESQSIHFHHEGRSQIWLDKQLLRNILFNLLSNAIKYSDDDKPIFFRSRAVDERLYIDIEDRGIGIPESEQQLVFDRFFRATNAGGAQGTGLGLNIVKGYVELMGGTVSLSSELGQGTTFHIVLEDKVLPELDRNEVD